jgi:hypothetical protein
VTFFAYKLHRCFLNGWIESEKMIEDVMDVDLGDEFVTSWREEIAARVALVAPIFIEMGWEGSETNDTVWFAPLPVAYGSAFGTCNYMIAVETDDETFIASPFELTWLTGQALDVRRIEPDAQPPSTAIN